MCQMAASTDPSQSRAWWTLAQCSARLGRTPESIGALTRAIECDWFWFAAADNEPTFQLCRTEVRELQNRLRERERERAEFALQEVEGAGGRAWDLQAEYTR